jgi:hypothetical protein
LGEDRADVDVDLGDGGHVAVLEVLENQCLAKVDQGALRLVGLLVKAGDVVVGD